VPTGPGVPPTGGGEGPWTAGTADPDQRVLSDEDLEQAVKEGQRST
jgi:hypothetical protein